MTRPPGAGRTAGAARYTFFGTDVISPATVLPAIIGSALFVTVVAMIAFGLGAIIRHTAGAITSAIGLLFVLPIIIQILPDTWRWDIMRFFPDAAGRVVSVTIGQTNPHLWSAWPQFGVTAAVGRRPCRHRRLPVPQARRLTTNVSRQRGPAATVAGRRSTSPWPSISRRSIPSGARRI